MKAKSVPVATVALRPWILGGVYAAASGALLALALPPYDVPLLGFVAFAPLLAAIFHAPRYAAVPYGLITACVAGCVLMGLPFTAQNGNDYFALVPFGVFGAFLGGVLRGAQWLGASRGWTTILGVSSIGVLVEWLAARIDFPYMVALALWRDVPILWLASWGGVWGLSFLVWMINTAVAQAWSLRRLTSPFKLLAGALLGLHALGWLQMSLTPRREPVRVAVVQSHSLLYPELIRQAKAQGAQIVALPEVSWDPVPASSAARAAQLWLIVGYWTDRNSVSLVAPDGSLSEPYYKMYPYGGEPVSWRPGDPIRTFKSPFGNIGAVICYDTMFTEPCRRQVLNGARLIAVPTLDPTTPNLAFHHLHAATTTLRAAEHRTPLARSEYEAGSMIADEWGRVLAYASERNTIAIADVPLGSGRGTLATYLGDWMVLGYALLLAGVWLRERIRAPRAASGSHSARNNESSPRP
ncbi:MAG: apolipoprotein N-acyltransferase [Fimbriimonadales bacterium]|nr:MAG: apolipoprotein N-acyltransferase [Fimbriimonadales bacterium]